ncbi:nucleoside deaminase [Armatimonas sp.]|uniref:nucleoside deaminase n=1 Tax=Armatimonas sp. TaxID=1872638 RepID=UPI00286C0DB9|nr:nucleoside deaminase [Armatimonas sp.]
MRTDEEHLRELIAFTLPHKNPFGARIVESATGEVLLQAINQVGPNNDPTAHAELLAVRLACQQRQSFSLAGFTLYSTCEPCPMCLGSILWARLDRVVFGATIEDAAKHYSQIYIPAQEVARRSDFQTIVEGPLLQAECYTLFTPS